MLYHFAITPDAFEPDTLNAMSPPGVVLVELLRGICDSGLLANLHGGHWLTEIRSNQGHEGMPPDLRDRIEACLTTLFKRNRLSAHPPGQEYSGDDFAWLKRALDRHANITFRSIVSSDEHLVLSELADESLVGLSNALDSPHWIDRKRSTRFIKTVSNLQRNLSPIVRHASKVSLIDPYMTCREPRFFDTVQECADLMENNGTIHIHAGNPERVGPEHQRESVTSRLGRWEAELQPVANHSGHKFRVLLWGRKPQPSKQFHDRYIVTDQCGLEAPGGLDFLEDAKSERANATTWSMLDHKDAVEIQTLEFHHAKSPYNYLGSREILP